MMKRVPDTLGNVLLLMAVLALTACGFHLRGQADLSFSSIYIQKHGSPAIAKTLERSLKSNGISVVPVPEEAELHLELMGEKSTKNILSLSGGGKVREYELIYEVTLRMRDGANPLWDTPQTIELRRDYSYDDTQVLAKEGEEARLFNDMRTDATREIMRRLSVRKTSATRPAS